MYSFNHRFYRKNKKNIRCSHWNYETSNKYHKLIQKYRNQYCNPDNEQNRWDDQLTPGYRLSFHSCTTLPHSSQPLLIPSLPPIKLSTNRIQTIGYLL